MIVFLVGKLQNSANPLHNSKRLIGNVFYGSRLWAPWEAMEFPCSGSDEAWECFFEAFLWLGWMTSNTCFENFPSQIISVVPYVMKHWGPSKTFFHVLELTPSCWRRAAVWFWLVLLQGLLQPIPSWWWWGSWAPPVFIIDACGCHFYP